MKIKKIYKKAPSELKKNIIFVINGIFIKLKVNNTND